MYLMLCIIFFKTSLKMMGYFPAPAAKKMKKADDVNPEDAAKGNESSRDGTFASLS